MTNLIITQYLSVCALCEHSVCDARCDYQDKLGQAVLTASPGLQLPLGGWPSAAATDVRDALCRAEKSTYETGTLKVETCTLMLPGFGTSNGAVIAKERLCLSLSRKKSPAVQM